MFHYLVLISFSIAAVNAGGQFIVLYSPENVEFSGGQTVDQSLLTQVYAAALGFTVDPKSKWSGIKIYDPFELPKAVVNIAVEGVDSLGPTKSTSFPLNNNENEETTWQAISGLLSTRDEKRENKNVRFYLGDGEDALGQSALGELKPSPVDQSSLDFLSLKNDEDKKFLEQVHLLKAISKKITSTITKDPKPGVYWLVVSGLRPVIDLHKKELNATQEAFSLLNDALEEVSKSFVHGYKGEVLITAFTNDATQVRRRRSPEHSRVIRATNGKNEMNLASKYDESYPVFFNIMLWFGVVIFFSLLAVCVAIASMDPGRDSIIYRMTSNRMKKEN